MMTKFFLYVYLGLVVHNGETYEGGFPVPLIMPKNWLRQTILMKSNRLWKKLERTAACWREN